MADGKPKRPQYALPDEYGPARAPRRVEELDRPRGPHRPARDAVPPPDTDLRHHRSPARAAQRSASTSAPTAAPARAKARWIRRGIAIAVIVLLIPVVWSYVHALQRPGTDSLGVRSVEWIRDHGGNGIVNTIERWWYTNNPPVVGGKPDQIRVQGTGGEVTVVHQGPHRDDHAAARAPAAADAARHHSRTQHREQRRRLDARRSPRRRPPRGVHHVRPPRRGAHLVLRRVDVARHEVAQGGVRARIAGAGWRCRTRGAPRFPTPNATR